MEGGATALARVPYDLAVRRRRSPAAGLILAILGSTSERSAHASLRPVPFGGRSRGPPPRHGSLGDQAAVRGASASGPRLAMRSLAPPSTPRSCHMASRSPSWSWRGPHADRLARRRHPAQRSRKHHGAAGGQRLPRPTVRVARPHRTMRLGESVPTMAFGQADNPCPSASTGTARTTRSVPRQGPGVDSSPVSREGKHWNGSCGRSSASTGSRWVPSCGQRRYNSTTVPGTARWITSTSYMWRAVRWVAAVRATSVRQESRDVRWWPVAQLIADGAMFPPRVPPERLLRVLTEEPSGQPVVIDGF